MVDFLQRLLGLAPYGIGLEGGQDRAGFWIFFGIFYCILGRFLSSEFFNNRSYKKWRFSGRGLSREEGEKTEKCGMDFIWFRLRGKERERVLCEPSQI